MRLLFPSDRLASNRRRRRPMPANEDEILPGPPVEPAVHWTRRGVSLGVSLLIHALLVVLLGLTQLSGQTRDELPGEEVKLGELPGETLDADSPTEQLDVAIAGTEIEAFEDAETVAPAAPVIEQAQLAIDAPSLQAVGGAMASPSLLGQGGSGAAGQASFMGVQAYGRRFCIIADRSGSMKGQPIAHLKREVRKTLDTMTHSSSIHLVFYNNSYVAFPDAWGAPRKSRAEAEAWLAALGPGGGTNPGPAFEHAFALEPPPDAIFFMTDGKIPGNMNEYVEFLNGKRPRRIPIHTIAFLNPTAAKILERIATDSGGKYRYVADF